MKKLFFTFCFAMCGLLGIAQGNLYQSLKKMIGVMHPEINTENKLIAFNVWSASDQDSREINKSFEKTFSVYESARLKGGSKGIVVVAINKDNLSPNAVITLTKDGTSKIIPVKLEDIEGLNPQVFNGVYDSGGNQVYTNLSAQNVYSSINRLITR